MENNIVKEIYDLRHLIHCYASDGDDLRKHMNVTQFQVMMYLFRHEKDDVCQKDLESEIHLTKASITGCLDSLEDMGFVQRVRAQDDRRKKIIILTKKASSVKNKFHERFEKLNAQLLHDISDDDLAAFYRVAGMIEKNLSRKA